MARRPGPAVSIVVPAYGVAPYVSETIASVLAQTFTDWELVVVNDGSPDTPELDRVLAPYLDRLIYIVQPNRGAAAARNAGVAVAGGRWIAFLDGDDLWVPEYLERQLARLAKGDLDMVWCDGFSFDRRGNRGPMPHFDAPDLTSARELLCGAVTVFTSGTVVRRDALLEVGGFDESLVRAQDFDMWVRLAVAGARIGFLPEPLIRYRIRAGSLTGDELSDIRRAITVYERLAEKLGDHLTLCQIIAQRLPTFRIQELTVRGKRAVQAGNYSEAREALRSALAVGWNWKLVASLAILRVWPQVLRYGIRKQPRDRDPFEVRSDPGPR